MMQCYDINDTESGPALGRRSAARAAQWSIPIRECSIRLSTLSVGGDTASGFVPACDEIRYVRAEVREDLEEILPQWRVQDVFVRVGKM